MSCNEAPSRLWSGANSVGEGGPPVSEIRHDEPVVAASARPPPRIDLHNLLKGAREAIILHDGQEYRLRITSNAKLILTK